MESWYYCKKCETLIPNRGRPHSGSCPSGGIHSWQEIAKVGNTNYRCKKCGMLVRAASRPSSSSCSAGGLHNWQKL